MQASEKTFRSMRRMHGLFWFSSLCLLATTVWMLVHDANRPWKDFQQEYRKQYSPNTPGGIRQITLPDLTRDINFRRVARCDRCTTCHLGIDRVQEEDHSKNSPHPFKSHPRLELFLGPTSPHPLQEFGCTICHEGQGSATDFHWASHEPNDCTSALSWKAKHAWSRNPDWDFPMLPGRFAESRCLQCHPNVTDLEPTDRFPDPPAAKLVTGYQLVRQLGCFGCHEINGYDNDGRTVGPDMRLEPFLPREANNKKLPPGTMRKVGPSLRQIAEKISPEHLADHLADPLHFQPESRMPRLFGLHEHLEGSKLAEAKRFEAVEIHAIAAYLISASEPASYPTATPSASSADRGKKLFEMQGCLACHKHQDFPQGQATQGPDLTRIGAKYTARNARPWLTAWLRDPKQCSPRTVMPNPRLENTRSTEGSTADPAEDLTAYLLASRGEFQNNALPPLAEKDLDALAQLYSQQNNPSFSPEPTATAGEDSESPYGTNPPNAVANQPSAGARSALNEDVKKKLQNLGRQAIAKRGCYGCHDIPGFEQSQGIGPTLSNWGRKPTAQLAFEKIEEFVKKDTHIDSNHQFFTDALAAHRREGFLWQKLGAPRSFDYRVASQKHFNEYLRMGRFRLTDAEREAIMTFVLGLTADPPQGKYVYRPNAKRKAIIEGRKVLDRFACAACHTLELERWTIAYKPGEFPDPPPFENFEFLKPKVSAQELTTSQSADRTGFAQAEIVGMPRLDSSSNVLEDEDDEERPIHYFSLWQPAAIDGKAWAVGGPEVVVPASQITKKRPPWGGTLARMLYPVVSADARAKGFGSPEQVVWGWLPPVLAEEGDKVHPTWLFEYLLNPTTIRPAAVMPMPKFNLSEADAAALVDFFAATANSDGNALPFVSRLNERQFKKETTNDQRSTTNDQAMRLLLDSQNFCAKCHLIGDYRPGGEGNTILAPNLAEVGRRLQPGYLHRWLADPKTVLPYTPMPQIFPPRGKPRGQDLLPGESGEQLDAVERLLLEYEEYAKRKMSIRKMMPPM